MNADGFDKLGMYRLIADKIERDPALLQVGLDNIARWIGKGIDQQHRLRMWEAMIHAAQASSEGIDILLNVLREDSEQADHMREFSPFAGVLTARQRRPFYQGCAFSH